MNCPRREELQSRALEALHNLNDLTNQQIHCLQAQNFGRLYEIDRQVELAFGAKERAFGALKEHSDEHGC
jgi:hypothetical protein